MDKLNPVFATTPLGDVGSVGNADNVMLSALPASIKISLRGDATDPAFQLAVKENTGLTLPLEPNTRLDNGATSLLWLGPDEWQWWHKNESASELDATLISTLIADFQSRLAGIHSAVIDISDYYFMMNLQGPETFSVLEKGSPLHLRQALADVSQCAQTRFGNAAVLLNRIEAPQLTVQIQVRWSYAEYLWQYLSEAMQEFN